MKDENPRRRTILKSVLAAAAAEGGIAKDDHQKSTPNQASSNSASPSDASKRRANNLKHDADAKVKSVREKLSSAPASPATTEKVLYKRDEAQWKKVQERAETYYSASLAKLGALQPASKSIDTGFKYEPKADDVYFRFQHAEVLLDQSADLLERALAARTEWNNLMVSAFNVAVELQEYFELDSIHQEETKAGFYTHDYREVNALYNAESLNSGNLQSQSDFLKLLLDWYYSLDNINSQSGSSQLLAFLSHLANYDKEAQDANFMSYGWNGVTQESYKHAKDATANLSFNNLNLQRATVSSQVISASNAALVSRGKATSYDAKRSWECVNSDFRLRRTEVSRRLEDVKAESYTSPGGALNYPERMTLLEARFFRDFRDALARVQVAEQGLKKLYGYSDALPDSVIKTIKKESATPAGAYDDCLIWVRNAIAFIVKFGQVEQRYSFPISLRHQLGEAAYKAGQRARPWATWKVDVSRELFPDQYHIRLRGVTMYVVPEDNLRKKQHMKGVWLGSVKAPSSSFCEHMPLQGQAPNREDLDQSKIPTAMAGRISHRESMRTPDIIGAATFYNVSPFNTWTIKLNPTSSEKVDIDEIDDVVVELHLALRMRG